MDISPGSPNASGEESSSLIPHVVLVGLPGAGKSTVGAGAARRLGVEFLDLDLEIERREGKSVSAIFAERGEGFFRACERAATEAVRSRPSLILAPGGGWVLDPANVALLRPPGSIIYLRVSPETALRRLGAGLATRPLLQHEPLAAIRRLLSEREAQYAVADAEIDTEVSTLQEVIARVAELASGFLAR
jgi:shikimate kinase